MNTSDQAGRRSTDTDCGTLEEHVDMACHVQSDPPALQSEFPLFLSGFDKLLMNQKLDSPRSTYWSIFLISVLGLYLELLLIRWIATEIRIFAYLQNTVLVVCFLGLGMGCFTCRQPVRPQNTLVCILIITACLAIPWTRGLLASISSMLSVMNDFLIWTPTHVEHSLSRVLMVVCGLVLTFFLMVLLWETFVPVGRQLGRLMADALHPIRAYSVNVAGSLVGTWLFVVLSVLEQPPFVWFGVFALTGVAFVGATQKDRLWNGSLMTAIIALAWVAGLDGQTRDLRWSPYQKLAMFEAKGQFFGDLMINVNNSGYQAMIDLSDSKTAADPNRFTPAMRGFSQYDLPSRLHPDPQDVLIVGAGSGNDVAGILRNNPKARVTAVEIDPVIISMGQRYHPERPYDAEHVDVVIDDARSFFARSQERFDLICFGLLDSHTTSAMTNARLDHFVYTIESLESARSLLKDDGVMVLSFGVDEPYIADRMAGGLKQVFGAAPMVFSVPPSNYGWGGVVFVAGDQQVVRNQLEQNPRLARLIEEWQTANPVELTGETRVATDDWPYIYLETNRIPWLYFLLGGLMLALFARGCHRLDIGLLIPSWKRKEWHFFFLGAAFMLLEVQGISKACVVLGSTWWVNAAVISGVLFMILLANAIAVRLPGISAKVVYALLFASCGFLYAFDLSSLAGIAYPLRAALVAGLTTLPLLFSGVLFAQSYSVAARKDLAFGANLFGALMGAMFQTLAFVTGIQALMFLVVVLYGLAMYTGGSRAEKVVDVDPSVPGGIPENQSIDHDNLAVVN